MMVRFGIDRVGQYKELLEGRVALITAPSGRTADNRSSIDRLKEVCDLQLLLAPEHGVRGDKGAGELFEDCVDAPSGLPMMSLYRKGSKGLSQEALERFDTLVYDIQDVGCRYYTFISTLKNAMEDCAKANKRLVVLDRGNPLGGLVEGTTLQAECRSFVGCWEMPQRYGLTCGEFARMVNGEEHIGCDLHVVPCEGLTREMTFSDWGRLWVMPSLAMPRFETALLYPGTCLLEGTNWSEGRGTADPFAIVGAPGVDADRFSEAFNRLDLPGVVSTPVYFVPVSSKHKGATCGGVHLHVTDGKALRPVELGYRLLELAKTLFPETFALLPPYSEGGKPFMALLAGNRALEDADWTAEGILSGQARDCAAFAEKAEPYRLY
ncbi:MAG: DUF1343 domain-containing protein [Clostridia bacterium]|nr:DUF1343 domain-containing protein [Clostridia bacterium]